MRLRHSNVRAYDSSFKDWSQKIEKMIFLFFSDFSPLSSVAFSLFLREKMAQSRPRWPDFVEVFLPRQNATNLSQKMKIFC